MNAQAQEWVALGIVAIAAAIYLFRVFNGYAADPLSRWLLRKGKVAWAMRLRSQGAGAAAAAPGCGSCEKGTGRCG